MAASTGPKYEKNCKVCNSKFRSMIENLKISGMSPEKIFNYLKGLESPTDKAIVQREDINPSSIRRHMAKHFDIKDGVIVKMAESEARIEQSRGVYQQGVAIVIDKVNTVSHLIEVNMAKLEKVETDFRNQKLEHTMTVQYTNTIRGLIETLAKLTGDLKQEGNIDVNFFNNEITIFAEIVLSTIRKIDKELGLNGTLEIVFAQEFKNQWDAYRLRQQRIMNGDLSPTEGQKELNLNTFNVVKNDDDF